MSPMIRKTITIDDELYELLQRLRAKMIGQGKDMSFAGTVNIVMMSGILGSEKFDEKIWSELAEFFEHPKIEDNVEQEIEQLVNNYTVYLLRKIKKLEESHNL